MDEKEKNKRIRDLLYLQQRLGELIHGEIVESVMRNRPHGNEEIKRSITYWMDEILR